jgi:hypothetical protein
MALSNDAHRSNRVEDRKRQNEQEDDGPKAAHKRDREIFDEEDLDDEFNFDIEER